MSFILDALKKSDQKRQEGKVPRLETVSEESKLVRPKRLLWPLLLACALLANAAVISLWFFIRDSNKPDVVVTPQPPATQAPQTPAVPAAPPVPAKPAAPRPAFPALQPGKTVAPAVSGQPQKPAALADSNTAITAAPQAVPSPPAEVSPQTQRPVPSPDPETPELTPGEVAVTTVRPGFETPAAPQKLAPPVKAEVSEEAVVEEPITEEPVAEEESPPENLLPEEPPDRRATPEKALQSSKAGQQGTTQKNVLDILQLPAPVQSKLPKFQISAHFYSTTPPSRLASVNGRILREGQNLSPGLTLEEITPEGLIFRFEGYLFQVGVY